MDRNKAASEMKFWGRMTDDVPSSQTVSSQDLQTVAHLCIVSSENEDHFPTVKRMIFWIAQGRSRTGGALKFVSSVGRKGIGLKGGKRLMNEEEGFAAAVAVMLKVDEDDTVEAEPEVVVVDC